MSYYAHTNRQLMGKEKNQDDENSVWILREDLFCIGHSLPNTIHRVLLHIHVVCNLHNQQSQHSADYSHVPRVLAIGDILGFWLIPCTSGSGLAIGRTARDSGGGSACRRR